MYVVKEDRSGPGIAEIGALGAGGYGGYKGYKYVKSKGGIDNTIKHLKRKGSSALESAGKRVGKGALKGALSTAGKTAAGIGALGLGAAGLKKSGLIGKALKYGKKIFSKTASDIYNKAYETKLIELMEKSATDPAEVKKKFDKTVDAANNAIETKNPFKKAVEGGKALAYGMSNKDELSQTFKSQKGNSYSPSDSAAAYNKFRGMYDSAKKAMPNITGKAMNVMKGDPTIGGPTSDNVIQNTSSAYARLKASIGERFASK